MSVTYVAGPAASLFVDDGGPRDSGALPVVFVHSFAGNTAHWSAALEHLRPARRAIALDLRGHGRSDPPRDDDYSIEAMGRDIGTVADSLGLQRFVVVGHSQGGDAALAYAGEHPDRVAGLLLVDAPADTAAMAPEVKLQIDEYLAGLASGAIDSVSEGYLQQIAGPNLAVRERLLRDLRATPRTTVLKAGIKAIMQFDPKPSLDRFRGPTRAIVTSQNDMPNSLHRIGRGLPHEVVTGTGHWLQLDRPEEFNRKLDQFLVTLG